MTGDLVERLRALLDDRELTIDELPWLCGCGHCDASDARDEALRTIQAHRSVIDWARHRLPYAEPILRGLAAIYLPDIEP